MDNFLVAQSNDPLHRLFADSSVALALLDESGTIVEANDSFKRLFETLSGQALASLEESLPEFFRTRDAYRFSYHFSRLTTGSSLSMTLDTTFRIANGDHRWLRLRAWVVAEAAGAAPTQRGPFIALMLEDNTERRKEERKLLAAKEQAERTTETKSQFLANMSHEIRTPIQTIIGMMELLQETRLDSEQEEYSKQVKFSADVLLSLVNDILDYSKIEADRMLLEHIDFEIDAVVGEAVDLICMEAHKKGLEMTVDIAAEAIISVRGDPNRLRQVIMNLVKNAVKFTREGGIIVSVRRTEYEGKKAIIIAVADTGIGVAPDLRSRLFTTFFQGDASTTRRFGGTGLGLAISRHLVRLMGGEIGMSPNEPDGSIFHFTIPFEELGVAAPIFSSPLAEGVRILVVDDAEPARRVLTRYLSDLGYAHSETASSGDDALRMMRAAVNAGRPFTLCLIDMIMPGMDGWRLASAINKDHDINSAKLILLIPQGTMGADAKMTLLRWFNANINKPIKRRDLAEILVGVLLTPLDLEATTDEAESDLPPTAAVFLPEVDPAESASTKSASAESASAESLLPKTPVATAVPAKTATASAEAAPAVKVLIVEDHEVNQKLFALIMEKLGCEAYIAGDGLEALEAAKDRNYAVIFMDIQMPRMNGYEAAKRLRENGYIMPIIAVTAGVLEEERKRCQDAGMNDILTKPFKRADIENMLHKALAMPPLDLLSSMPPSAAPPSPISPSSGPRSSGPPSIAGKAASDTELGELEELPGIEADPGAFDAVAAVENFMGRSDTVKSLLKRYIERCDGQMTVIPALIQAADWEKVDMEAHTIKGSALNLSASGLAAAAYELEKAAKTKTGVEAKFPALRQAYARFRTAAMDFIAKRENGA